ncbi:MAG: Hsp70 family protein [Deltaproteobacteria bacterium]|nr:Hsp70 family protein [Deltaproteobacteria bacterium]
MSASVAPLVLQEVVPSTRPPGAFAEDTFVAPVETLDEHPTTIDTSAPSFETARPEPLSGVPSPAELELDLAPELQALGGPAAPPPEGPAPGTLELELAPELQGLGEEAAATLRPVQAPEPLGEAPPTPAAEAPPTPPTEAPPTPAAEAPPTPATEAPPTQALEAPPPTQALEAPPSTQVLEAPPPTQALEAPPPTQALEAPPPTQALEAPPPTQALEAPPPTQALEAPPPTQALEAPPPTQMLEAPHETRALEAPPETLALEAPPETLALEAPREAAALELSAGAPVASFPVSEPVLELGAPVQTLELSAPSPAHGLELTPSTAEISPPAETLPREALEPLSPGFDPFDVDAELEATFGPSSSQGPRPSVAPAFEAVHASALTSAEVADLTTVEPHFVSEADAQTSPPSELLPAQAEAMPVREATFDAGSSEQDFRPEAPRALVSAPLEAQAHEAIDRLDAEREEAREPAEVEVPEQALPPEPTEAEKQPEGAVLAPEPTEAQEPTEVEEPTEGEVPDQALPPQPEAQEPTEVEIPDQALPPQPAAQEPTEVEVPDQALAPRPEAQEPTVEGEPLDEVLAPDSELQDELVDAEPLELQPVAEPLPEAPAVEQAEADEGLLAPAEPTVGEQLVEAEPLGAPPEALGVDAQVPPAEESAALAAPAGLGELTLEDSEQLTETEPEEARTEIVQMPAADDAAAFRALLEEARAGGAIPRTNLGEDLVLDTEERTALPETEAGEPTDETAQAQEPQAQEPPAQRDTEAAEQPGAEDLAATNEQVSPVFSDLLAGSEAAPKASGAALQMEIEAAMAAAMAAAEAEEKSTREAASDLAPPRSPSPSPAPPTPTPAPPTPTRAPEPASQAPDAQEKVDEQFAREVLDARPQKPAEPVVFKGKAVRLPAKSQKCVGIDLGTMFSCVAITEGGRPKVIPSRQGTNTIPSVVSFLPDEQILIGLPAQKQQLAHPSTTIVGGKRLVGRKYHSPLVQQVIQHVGYDIVEGEGGEAAVMILGRPVALTEVSAHILREIREYVRLHLKEEVNRAVITCPAYYNERQRQSVRIAGELAGWHVERVLNEPTAAALAYGFGRGLSLRRVLIYDLGGGTFDASLLEIEADVYQVLASGGDTFLGGMDFDEHVAMHVVELVKSRYGIDPTSDATAFNRIAVAAEQVKRDLSDHQETRIHLDYFKVGASGKNLTIDLTISRKDVEPGFEPLVDRTLEICADVLKRAGLTTSDVEDVILVGGQTRAPIVRKKVREYFAKEPRREVHPDEAVALGAANYAQSLDTFDAVQLFDTVPMAIGVGLPGGRFKKVIERDSKLPATHTYAIRTTRDDQTEIEIDVFQGDSDDVEQNEPLGTLKVPDLPRGGKGSVVVRVTFHVSSESILSLTAEELTRNIKVKTQFSTVSTPDEIRRRLGIRPRPKRSPTATGASKEKPPEKKGFWGWFRRAFGENKD